MMKMPIRHDTTGSTQVASDTTTTIPAPTTPTAEIASPSMCRYAPRMLWSSFAPRNPTQDGGDLTGLGLEDVEIIAEQLDGDVAAHAADEHQHVTTAIHQFLRMYRPHASREDTILFPAFRELVSGHEYEALGEKFENREHELFGKEGLEGVLVEVAKLEAAVGISDLSIFTPAG